jgi:methyl-accepting chemotaxis protein|nr:MAG TPA: tail tape measure [Caudoviricetes sp.]
MAKTTDSLVIDVSVNSNDVIKFFEVLSDKLNQLLGYAQSAGEKLDSIGDSTDGINKASASFDEVSQNAKKTSKEVGKVGESGETAGKKVVKSSKDASKSLSQLDSVAKRVFAAIKSYAAPLAAMFGAKFMFGNFLDEGAKLDDISKKVRMNVSEIDAWRKANVAAGGSAEAFTQAMQAFTERTGASGEVFLRMGKQLNGMTGAQANYALKYLGLTRESAAVFLQNNKQMGELVETYRKLALTPKDAENARRFKISWQVTGMAIQNIGNQFAKFFIPWVEKAVKIFGDASLFIGEHSQFIKIALTGIATATALAFGPKSALMMAGKLLGLLASPIGFLIAGVLLLAGAIDDLIVFAKGGPSVFEDFLKSVGYTDDQIKGIRKSFQDAWKSISDLLDKLSPLKDMFLQAFGDVVVAAITAVVGFIGDLAKDIANLINTVPKMKDNFIKAWEDIESGCKRIFKWLEDKMKFFTDWKLPDWASKSIDTVGGWFGLGDDKKAPVTTPPGAQAGAAASIVPKAASPVINAPMKTDVSINIQGNADPQAVKDATHRGVTEGMGDYQDMLQNSASGYRQGGD